MHGVCVLFVILSVTRSVVSVHVDVSEHRTQPAQDDVRSRLPNRFVKSLEQNNLTRPLINNQRHIGSSSHTKSAKETNTLKNEVDVRAFTDRPVLRRVLNPRPVSEHRSQPAQDDVRSILPHRFIKSLERNTTTLSLINNQRHGGFAIHSNSAKQTNRIKNEVDVRTFPNRQVLKREMNPRMGRYKEIPNASIVSPKLASSGKSNMNHVNFDNSHNTNQIPVRPLTNRIYKERRLPPRGNLYQSSQRRPMQRTWRRNRHIYQGGSRARTSQPRRHPQTVLRIDPLTHEQRMYLDLRRDDRRTDNNRWRRRHVTSYLPTSVNRNRQSMPTTRHQQPNHATQPTRNRDRETISYFFEERRGYNNQPIQSSRRHFERNIRHFSRNTSRRQSTETTKTNRESYRQQSHLGTGRHYREPLLN